MSSGLFQGTPRIASSLTVCYIFAVLSVILLHFIPYSPLYTSVYISQLHLIFINTEPTASHVRNHYSQKNQEAQLERSLARALKTTAYLHWQSNVWTSNPAFKYGVGDSWSPQCNCYEAGLWRYWLGDQREQKWRPWRVHLVMWPRGRRCGLPAWGPDLDWGCHDMIILTTRVPRPKKRSRADNVIVLTSHANLQHPAGAIAPQLLKQLKSTINIICESDIVPTPALPLPMVGGDQNVTQPNSGGDHHVLRHPMATIEVAKWFMETIVFTMIPWPISSDERYLTVDIA